MATFSLIIPGTVKTRFCNTGRDTSPSKSEGVDEKSNFVAAGGIHVSVKLNGDKVDRITDVLYVFVSG